MSTEAMEPAGAQGLLSSGPASPAVDALLVMSTDEAPDSRARPERARTALLALQLRTAEHEAAAAERAEQAWDDGGAYDLLKARLDRLVQRRRDELAAELEQARLEAGTRRAGIARAKVVPPAVAERASPVAETLPSVPNVPVAVTGAPASLPAVDVDLLARTIAREIVAALPPAARGEGPPRARVRADRDRTDRARADRADRARADRAREPVRRTLRDELDDSPEVASRPQRAPRPQADRADRSDRADRTRVNRTTGNRARAGRTRGTEERAPRARADSRAAGAPNRPKRASSPRADRGETVVEQTSVPTQQPAQPLRAKAPFWKQLLHLDVALPLLAVLVVLIVLLAWVG